MSTANESFMVKNSEDPLKTFQVTVISMYYFHFELTFTQMNVSLKILKVVQ